MLTRLTNHKSHYPLQSLLAVLVTGSLSLRHHRLCPQRSVRGFRTVLGLSLRPNVQLGAVVYERSHLSHWTQFNEPCIGSRLPITTRLKRSVPTTTTPHQPQTDSELREQRHSS